MQEKLLFFIAAISSTMIFITDSKAACTGPLGDGYDDCVAFELTDAPRFSASSICDYREAIGMTSSWDSVNGVLTISIDPNTGDGIPAVRRSRIIWMPSTVWPLAKAVVTRWI